MPHSNSEKHKKRLKKILDRHGKSTGKIGFYDKRATTGYRYAIGKRQQGPHTMAHITKRVALQAAIEAGIDPLLLRGTAAFPRPRVMNKRMRHSFRERGTNWQQETRKQRTAYLKAYLKAWKESSPSNKNQTKRLDALRRGMELNPATVYNIGKGTTSSSQIAGKGENRQKAAQDLWKLVNAPSGKIPKMETIDLSGANPHEKHRSKKMVASIGQLLKGEDIDSDSSDSESDSEIELDDY